MSTVMFSGNVVKDAVLRTTKSGRLLEMFTVAVPRRFKPEDADFINVVSAVDCAEKAVKKGDSIRVSGYLNSYKNKEGLHRTTVHARSIIPVVGRKYRPNFAMVNGRLTKDAEVSEVNGRWCMRFTVAENHGENPATFICVEQWRKDEPKFTIHKGDFVMVMGSIRVSATEKNGVWYENFKIVADDIETAIRRNRENSQEQQEQKAENVTADTAVETEETEMEMPDVNFSEFNLAGDEEVPF